MSASHAARREEEDKRASVRAELHLLQWVKYLFCVLAYVSKNENEALYGRIHGALCDQSANRPIDRMN